MAKRKQSAEGHAEALADKIVRHFGQHRNEELNYKQVTEGIGLKSKSDREEVQDMLYELLRRGVLREGKPGRFRLAGSGSVKVTGTVDMTASGSAYVVCDDREAEPDDVFVSAENCGTAMHGDHVEVVIFARRRGRQPEGEITQILERKRETYVGLLDVGSTHAFLVCNAKQTGGHDIYIPLDKLGGGKRGDKAVAKIVEWPSGEKNPVGEVIAVLGAQGDNQTEMHAILAEYGLPYSYPEAVAQEAETIAAGITAEEVGKRLDMRQVTTFTIDPKDAKDFDDALSYRELENGNYEVGIHIADVTHYVKPGDIIDQEGYSRATSVYLVDRVVPMLPERLSNFLCSLRPGEEKLTFSVIAELNEEAEIVQSRIAKTVICSDRRFTYEEAQAIIEGETGDCQSAILKLNELAQKLRKRRFENGAIGFERVEPRFEIDDAGHPTSVYFKEAKASNMLVEEFMLLANRRVAEYIGRGEIDGGKKAARTFVYRVHDKPSEERYEKFSTFIRRFGYEAQPQKGEEINNAVNRVMGECKGKAEQNLVELLALRTMAKAIYTTQNIGHYGLAFEYYTHFTSPIRRYPDMMVHRLLFDYMQGGSSAKAEKYEEYCQHCSQQEVMAAEAERDSIKYKQAEYLLDHLGEDFPATISGVTEWGIYAELDANKCEGMISVRDLRDDQYVFDEENYCLVGRNTGKRFQLGDAISVRIANANLEKKQVDLALSGTPALDVEKQNQKVLSAGGDLAKLQRERALASAELQGSSHGHGGAGGHGFGGARARGGNGKRGHGHGGVDKGGVKGIPPKSVLKKAGKARRRKK